MAARPPGSGGAAPAPVYGGVAASPFGGAAAFSPFGPRTSRDIVRRSLEAVRFSMERVHGSGLPLASAQPSGSAGRYSSGSGGRLSGAMSADVGRLSLDTGRLSSGSGGEVRLSVRASRDGSSRRLPRLSLQFITPFTALAQQGFSDDEDEGDDMSEESEDAELVDQLAAEAAADLADRGTVPGTMSRVRQLSQQLADIAASLSPDNAAMLLERGYSMVRVGVGGGGALAVASGFCSQIQLHAWSAVACQVDS